MNSPKDNPDTCTIETAHRCELEENLDILRNVPALSGIPLEKLRLYAYLSKRTCYRGGDFIFRQGDQDRLGYIIISGEARLIREYEDYSLFLEELEKGAFFGGLALFSDIKRLFSARAVTNLECLTLDRDSFQKLILQFPEIAIKVLDVMIRRIAGMEEKLLSKKVQECFHN